MFPRATLVIVRVALDATYAEDPNPTGVGLYSRHILDGLSEAYPSDLFLHCVRLRHFRKNIFRAPSRRSAANVSVRLLQPPIPIGADLFHALNQRVDRRPSPRVITTFHDLFVLTEEYSTAEFRDRFADQAKRAASNSDLIIAVSAFTATQVCSLLGVEASRIRVIPHGADPPPIDVVPVTRDKLILTVGALQKRKNTLRLIEAFESARTSDWSLVLAGSPGGYGAAGILDRIARSPARDRIEVTGYVSAEQLASFYQRAAIFAFPSLDEGFGIPVLEAMAFGVPVLTSNRSALSEVAGSAALLVDPLCTDKIAEGLRQLMQRQDLRADLSKRGRLRAAEFPWTRAVQQTYEVYRELLGKPKSSNRGVFGLHQPKSSEPEGTSGPTK
jgi:glycosyltransferase involved in cell wall biosynthesis